MTSNNNPQYAVRSSGADGGSRVFDREVSGSNIASVGTAAWYLNNGNTTRNRVAKDGEVFRVLENDFLSRSWLSVRFPSSYLIGYLYSIDDLSGRTDQNAHTPYAASLYFEGRQTGDENAVTQDSITGGWSEIDLISLDIVIYPDFKGQPLKFIPFTICNVDRLGIEEWQTPPFLDMAHSTVNAYNADSIYKQAMVNHATPTLVVLNGTVPDNMTLGGILEIKGLDAANAKVTMMETNAGGLAELGRCAKSIKEDAMRRTIFGMLESVGANTSGTAITLRTAAGTATIGEMDRAGARAIEEILCYAAVWSGMTWDEAGQKIAYEVDTSYMANQGTIQEFVSLMGANLSMGTPFLSKQNLYSIVQKLYPSTLTDWDINELQKEDEGFSSPMTPANNGETTSG